VLSISYIGGCDIVKEVCEAIVKHIGPLYLKVPSTTEEWLEIAAKFEERWNYPNCVGAIDGKHIVMQPPANAGSFFYNYKHTADDAFALKPNVMKPYPQQSLTEDKRIYIYRHS
jgi:hypothetical protein